MSKKRLITTTVPKAGYLLGLGKYASYEAARRGDIPVIAVGRRKLVPIRALEELLRLDPGTLTKEDFELLPIQIGAAARTAILRSSSQFVSRVENLHSLGARAVGELLLEVCRSDDLLAALERYAHLDPKTLRQLGRAQFPKPEAQHDR